MRFERLAVLARISLVLLVVTTAAAAEHDSDVLVAIAPCRLVDTSVSPSPADFERQVALRATRCGRIIPAAAKAYAVVVTRTPQSVPEKLPQGLARVVEAARKVPVPASGQMSFGLAPGELLAVDVVGYYVAAGTPAGGNGDETDAPLAKSPGLARNDFIFGQAGTVDTSGTAWSLAGVYMAATSGHPWIVAQLGNANGSSAFSFRTPGSLELMRVRSDGVWQMSSNANFYDGRTDFFGTPGAGNAGVSIPTNVIHDVTLVNPLDSGGGAANRVTFFNAWTWDENGSPATTKFQARTGGFYGQENVNFHSIVHWHTANQFHFRATSSAETEPNSSQPKDTFWVKAATGNTITSNTRADLYLSGRAGIGTKTPAAALQVEDLSGDVETILSAGDDLGGIIHSPTLTLMRKDGFDNQAAKYGFRLDGADGNKLKLFYGSTGAYESAPLLYVDPNSSPRRLHFNGQITAASQDLAEWVPAATDMAPGTVVVLNPDKSNEVMPSSRAYDTRVAGVVSAEPGLLLGIAGNAKEMIATTGRVKVKVDATAAPVRIGDLLVSSGKPGMAMKSQPVDVAGVEMHRPGTIIGKALEPLGSGEGEILVLLSLQ